MDGLSGLIIASLGVVALLASLVKSLIEIRKAQAQDLPTAFRGAGLWIALAVVSVVVVLFGALDWWSSRPSYTLTVQVFEVKSDLRSGQLAAERFAGEGSEPSDAVLAQVVTWLDARLRQDKGVTDQPVTLHVTIPADVATKGYQYTMDPPGDLEAMCSVDSPAGKSRTECNQGVLALGAPFQLEIRRPGYEIWSVTVVPGVAQEATVTLRPAPIRVGVEAFAGRDTLASVIGASIGRRFVVTGPDLLAQLAEKIRREKLDPNNPVQQAYRTSLGVDYIVGGSFERRGRP